MMNKKDMTEEEIKMHYITPEILKKWDEFHVRMEFYFTKGRIIVDGKKAKRDDASKADYLLYHKDNQPLAVVEAKDNNKEVLTGLTQAMRYAKILDVPYAFASNGDGFSFHNMITHEEVDFMEMSEFPSEDELYEKYKKDMGITQAQEEIASVPYYYVQDYKEPRYYQWIAVNKVLDAFAKGENRMLIVLATGTGKTFVAFQIMWKLLQAKKVKKILFLADRDILVGQPMENDFAPLKKIMTRIETHKIDTSYQVYMSLYHQLKNGDEVYYTDFDRDFFDLIIIDECHRGSASEDSSWHEILDYFNSAVQVGLTATPKETEDVSNIEYFGEPIYTYSLKQGIADGFLAPYKVMRVNLDIDINGFRPYPGMMDEKGEKVEDRLYEQKDFDRKIVVKDRIRTVAKRITDFLNETDRYSKTIVFCEDIPHAERMRSALGNLNKDMMQENDKYIVQITGDNIEGKKQLNYFIDPFEKYPVIAITSKLMSTGVDSQTCKLVVLDKTVGSMTEFKQIIGRGTRVREDKDKLFFTIMDFRGNYVKFADPDFNDDPVMVKIVGEDDTFEDDSNKETLDEETQNEDNISNGNTVSEDGGYDTPEKNKKRIKYVVDGVQVSIVNERVEYLDANGKLITMSIIDYSRINLQKVYPLFEDFKNAWMVNKKKNELLETLIKDGVFVNFVKETLDISHVDDYDVVSYIGYDKVPITKEERIDRILISGYLDKFSKENQDIIKLLLEAYRNKDIDELMNMQILKMPEFIQINTPKEIVNGFGGKKQYVETLDEVEKEIYSA